MNKFKRDLNKFIGESPRFKESMKRQVLLKIKKEDRTKKFSLKGFMTFKYAAIFTILLVFVVSFLMITLNQNGPSLQNSSTGSQANSVLRDTVTVPEIKTFTGYEEPMELFEFHYDAMDRGNHEYAAYPLLIHPQAYKETAISRGDVVVYEYDFFDGVQKTVSRVIGLPGESIEILNGQIFIDGRKLESFYGKAHRVGVSSNEEYNEFLKANGAIQNLDSMKETFSLTTKKVQLAEDEVFLVGDDWFRGSQHSLKIEEIQGKVMGYYEK